MKEKFVYLFCAGYFLWFAGSGLTAPFLPDDMMNLYFAWFEPWKHERLAAQWILHGLFRVFGLNPLGFRAVCFGLLLFNLWLAYRLYLRLGGIEAAAPALLLFSYHAHMVDLYLSSGTIYDLLCFAFMYSALLLHIRWRQQEVTPGWLPLTGWALLYLLALGSKEMAVALPVLLTGYEAIYHRDSWRSRTLAASVVLAGAFVASRLLLSGAMGTNPAYHPDLRWTTFLDRWGAYLGSFIYQGSDLTPPWTLLALAGGLALAFGSRRQATLFGYLVFLAGALPAIFIDRRSLYVLYLPYLGLCLLLGAALESLFRRLPHRGLALMLALALALFPWHRWATPYAQKWHTEVAWQAPLAIEGLRRELPSPKRGARLLFLEDPYDRDEWLPVFAARLLYRDESLFLERQKRLPRPVTAEEMATYDAVFRLTREDGVRRISSATPPGPSTTGPAR